MSEEELKSMCNDIYEGGEWEPIIDLIKSKDKEIERLNNIIKGLREERDYLFNKTTTESNYEIDRLNNIINELEKYIKIEKEEYIPLDSYVDGTKEAYQNILDKLQKLKGDGSNDN